jgi:transposase
MYNVFWTKNRKEVRMSKTSIAQFFMFCKVKISGQTVFSDRAVITMRPDLRFIPHCSHCGNRTSSTHTHRERYIRDLNLADKKVWIKVSYRKVYCSVCKKVRVEKQEFVEPYARVTNRFACYIHELCKIATIKEVAEHTGLDWKTVKNIDKSFLEEEYGATDYTGLKILAVDEMAIRKGHHYVTVIIDYKTGRIVWMGKGRREETLDVFFREMPEEVRKGIVAIASDMWKPYLKAFRKWCPEAKIVYDFFHLVRDFNKVIDKVRNEEYGKANEEGKAILKGSKYLLLKNFENLKEKEIIRLEKVLKVNRTLSTAYILKDYLKEIYRHRDREQADMSLKEWCSLACESENSELKRFARKLKRHRENILNHCDYPIHTGKLEGMNNTLKVIKRDAYGFIDIRYFILKAKQAFSGISTN